MSLLYSMTSIIKCWLNAVLIMWSSLFYRCLLLGSPFNSLLSSFCRVTDFDVQTFAACACACAWSGQGGGRQRHTQSPWAWKKALQYKLVLFFLFLLRELNLSFCGQQNLKPCLDPSVCTSAFHLHTDRWLLPGENLKTGAVCTSIYIVFIQTCPTTTAKLPRNVIPPSPFLAAARFDVLTGDWWPGNPCDQWSEQRMAVPG